MILVPSGFNPWWNTEFEFEVVVPELALVRFVVEDYDASSKNDFIGQSTIPWHSLKQGECLLGCVKGHGWGGRAWLLSGWNWLCLGTSSLSNWNFPSCLSACQDTAMSTFYQRMETSIHQLPFL